MYVRIRQLHVVYQLSWFTVLYQLYTTQFKGVMSPTESDIRIYMYTNFVDGRKLKTSTF